EHLTGGDRFDRKIDGIIRQGRVAGRVVQGEIATAVSDEHLLDEPSEAVAADDQATPSGRKAGPKNSECRGEWLGVGSFVKGDTVGNRVDLGGGHNDELGKRSVAVDAEHVLVLADEVLTGVALLAAATGDEGHDGNTLSRREAAGCGTALLDDAGELVPKDERVAAWQSPLGDVDVGPAQAGDADAEQDILRREPHWKRTSRDADAATALHDGS